MKRRETFSVSIDLENDAFAESWRLEVARILRKVAVDIIEGEDFAEARSLLDLNGNYVGRAERGHAPSAGKLEALLRVALHAARWEMPLGKDDEPGTWAHEAQLLLDEVATKISNR